MFRNISNKINLLMDMFPVVVLLGARQTGKTTLVKALRPDWLYLDLEKVSDLARLTHDPEFFFKRSHTILLLMRHSDHLNCLIHYGR